MPRMLSDGTACSSVAKQHPEHRASSSPDEATFHLYISYISPLHRANFLHRTRFHSMQSHTFLLHRMQLISPSRGVVKCDTLPLFPRKNYPFPTIFRISLDKSSPRLYNIRTYVLFFGTAARCPPRKEAFAFPESVCTRQKFKGCRETRLPLPQAGISNCR